MDHLEIIRPEIAIRELVGINGRAMMPLQEPDGKPIRLPALIENGILVPQKNNTKEIPVALVDKWGLIPNNAHGLNFAYNEYMWGKTLVALEIRSNNKTSEAIFWTKYGNSLAVNMENGQISYVENISEPKKENSPRETPGVAKPGENIGKLIAGAVIKGIYDQQNLEDAGGETTNPTEWLENASQESQIDKESQRREALRMLNQFTEQKDHPRKILEDHSVTEKVRQKLIKFISDHKKLLVALPEILE